MENVTDPVKRSEALDGILMSISMIPPENTLRSEYLRLLSQRLQLDEQRLLNTMNEMIRKQQDEKEREKERSAAKQANDLPETEKTSETFSLLNSLSPSAEVERLLIQSVIRDGEKVIYENVETDNGELINLTVAQYISYDLGQDNLTFHDARYNQILEEAVAHSGEEGFKAETYFIQHPDVNISALAAELAIDRHQLGKGFQLKEREGGLKQHVLHLVLDLRLDIIEQRMKDVQQQLRLVGNDMERANDLLEEYKKTQLIRDALARQLGKGVVR